jgi:putative serine protease PepD
VPIVTDGSAWRPGGADRQAASGARDWPRASGGGQGTAAQLGAVAGNAVTVRGSTGQGATGQGSPWWTDALADPWRDPDAPAAVVVRPPVGPPPPAEPEVPTAAGGDRRGLRLVFLVSLVTALLAGALGGTLGYVFANRGGVGGHTVLGSGAGSTPSGLTARPPDSLAGVVAKVLPSVVTVKVGTSSGYSLGSGFIVSADGYVVTNDHVVEGQTGQTTITFSDDTTLPAKLVGADQESDIAVLKLDKTGLPAIQFGNSDQLAVGDPVLAIGSPLALANTVTYGIISALDRTIEADEPGGPTRYYAAIQTDAAVNHGNSGGPLIDASGRVIGVNAVIKSLSSNSDEAGNIGLAFAIPINQAKRIAQDIIDSGHARRTVIGAQLSNSYQNPNGGVEVTTVSSGGPAANAGIKPGDVLTRIDGVPLDQPPDLIALVRKYDPGTSVTVQYQRDGAVHTAQVTLTSDGN